MLIPKFSIRTYFIATVILAFFFIVLGCAVDGQKWAHGVSVAAISLIGAFILYWLLFILSWGWVELRSKRETPVPQSPFAGDEPPQQILPPMELCLLIGALFGSIFTGTAQAGTGRVHMLDGRRYGIQVEIDSTWVNANGYRPLRVRVVTSPPSASSTARKLRLVISPEMYQDTLIRVIDEIELPAGRRSAEKIIRVPQSSVWTRCVVDVYEGGRRLDDMSGEVPGFATGNNISDWTEIVPSILLIDSDAPLWRERQAGLPPRFQQSMLIPDPTGLGDFNAPINSTQVYSTPGFYGSTSTGSMIITESGVPQSVTLPNPATRLSDLYVLGSINLHPRREIISTKETLERWSDYTAADFIFISLADARQLAAQAPKNWEAILDWASVGHTLCIYETGNDWSALDEVDRLLSDSTAGWFAPPADKAGSGFDVITREFTGASVAYPQIENPPTEAAFRLRDLRFGKVVAFAPADPFLDQLNFTWMLASLLESDRSWLRRYGLSLHRENVSYWNWKIPGVGAPPVLVFLGLITLFAIVIGPVNYIWLRRIKRLHLLLITVPLGGMLTTGLLLSYALLADGLYTRVRTRSFVYLDQPRQKAITWSRQTYYAGMAPSEGLVLPETTVALPLDPSPDEARSATGEISWTGGQSLRGGFLRSRELRQYMMVDTSTNSARLDVVAGNPPSVTNELGGRVERLFLRLETGELFEATNIDVGATAKLKPLSEVNLGRGIRAALRDKFRLDPDETTSYASFGSGYNVWTGIDYNANGPNMLTSVLERSLALAQTGRLLTPGTYIAVVDQPTWLPVGVARARRQKCADVVYGRW